ncbi:hypothetical protein CAEBREN_00171 [Caenorhabditis brenneri]|uniref:G-protein coupled receptors family 1 profile domain-containing protein n=1 Tax=Caenorhabditis brenneri TaxID=135651 RepID=G0P0J8_CAEBE|nr:hypothetical protein CAEBREN_00171 [Caenorhabditis brenneri]
MSTVQEILNVMGQIENGVFSVNFFLCSLSILINCFHLIIITRKSMRTSSINVLMIGIAVCDLCSMFVSIYKYFMLVDRENPECITSDNLFKVYMDVTAWSFQYQFRRCSCWLGIVMATVRYVIMRRMSDVRHAKLAEPKVGFIIIAIVFFSSLLLTITWQFECEVIENRNYSLALNCAEHQNINSNPKFSLILRHASNIANVIIVRTYFILDATVSNFIPCFAFPTLTFLLLREIQKIKEAREQLRRNSVTEDNEEKYGLTTKLIVFLTVTFFMSEAPLGIIATVKTFLDRSDNRFRLSTDLIIYFTILVTINSILHPIFCILMSSQYRETVRSLFGVKRKTSTIFCGPQLSAVSTQFVQMT